MRAAATASANDTGTQPPTRRYDGPPGRGAPPTKPDRAPSSQASSRSGYQPRSRVGYQGRGPVSTYSAHGEDTHDTLWLYASPRYASLSIAPLYRLSGYASLSIASLYRLSRYASHTTPLFRYASSHTNRHTTLHKVLPHSHLLATITAFGVGCLHGR